MLTFLTEPDESSRKGQETKVSFIEFLIAREDAAELLELVDATLNQVAFFVQMSIIGAHFFAILLGWYDSNRTHVGDDGQEGFGIVTFVGNHMVTAPAVKQSKRLCDVLSLAASQDKGEWIAQCVDQQMNLGAKSTATAT